MTVNLPMSLKELNQLTEKNNVAEIEVNSYNPGDGRRYQAVLSHKHNDMVILSAWMSESEMQTYLDGILLGISWDSYQKLAVGRIAEFERVRKLNR